MCNEIGGIKRETTKERKRKDENKKDDRPAAGASLLLLAADRLRKYIGRAKAKEIALNDAKVTEKDIRDYDCELDKEVIGATVYEIEFDVGLDEYEYEIDATTGEILKSKVD